LPIVAEAAIGVFGVLGSEAALTQTTDDWVVGVGWAHYAPQYSSKPLTFSSPSASDVPGSGASISNADTLILSESYFVDSNWAVTGVGGVPPKFTLTGTGTLSAVGKLGEANLWGPALLGQYYFFESSSSVRPFMGLGVTYMWFTHVQLTSNLQGAVDTLINQPPKFTTTSANLDSTFAPVFNLGADWRFTKHLGASFTTYYIPAKTKINLTTRTTSGQPIATSHLDLTLNPIVTSLIATYRF
jgi:outer membrane protein